jgi:hypothetical protein
MGHLGGDVGDSDGKGSPPPRPARGHSCNQYIHTAMSAQLRREATSRYASTCKKNFRWLQCITHSRP